MVTNYMEILVEQMIRDLLEEDWKESLNCTCEECIDNIKAIALNNMKPFYITTKVGEVYGTYQNKEVQNKVDILSEIIKAKDIVAKNPKHSGT